MARGKATRSRLSSIDLLPDEATPYVSDAIDALKERKRTQEDIREELNSNLLELDIKPISKSAFNRKALWLAAYGQKLFEQREISAIMGEKLDEVPEGDIGMLTNEVVKSLVYDVVMGMALSGEPISPQVAKDVSLAIYRLERARETSVDSRAKIERNVKAKAVEAFDDAAAAGTIDADAAQEARRIMGFVE